MCIGIDTYLYNLFPTEQNRNRYKPNYDYYFDVTLFIGPWHTDSNVCIMSLFTFNIIIIIIIIIVVVVVVINKYTNIAASHEYIGLENYSTCHLHI